jgi:aminoglycoside phosphotransferase (APT) family kinase protein
MDIEYCTRGPGSFQTGPDAHTIEQMCTRALGDSVLPKRATELSAGMYNSTFLVEFPDREVVLRVAPPQSKQYASERHLMRNEHAARPFLAGIATLLPQLLAVDFTHEVLDRDYILYSKLPGVPATTRFRQFDADQREQFFEQVGTLAHRIASQIGPGFGSLLGPIFDTWSDALLHSITLLRTDCIGLQLDTGHVDRLAHLVEQRRGAFNSVTTPRFLHGDLWTANVMVDESSTDPILTGVFDWDRASWGDPLSDWSIYMASRRAPAEQAAFWRGYGPAPTDPDSVVRAEVYRARNLLSALLEMHRLGDTDDLPLIEKQLTEALNSTEQAQL